MLLRFRLWPALAAAILLALVAAPAAQASELDTALSIPATTERTCAAGPASGAGIVQRTVTATADGLVHARLAGQGRGDWDLAVFGASNRLVSGSASFGMRELAEAVVAKGEQLTVQACRRSGPAGGVRLTVDFLPLEIPTNPEKVQLARVSLPNDGARDALEASGVDQTEHARPGIQDVLLYGAADAAKLRRAGLKFEVLVPDVVKADRAALSQGRAQARRAPGDGSTVPSGRSDYRRLNDYSADMKKLVAENPDLVKPLTLPFPTLEGRPVEGIEITQDVSARDGKPIFLQMGVHHAREWPSGEHAIEWAFELVKGWRAKDKRVRSLLNASRVIVVPIVNPDGFNLSREEMKDVPVGPIGLVAEAYANTGFAYKRRNCRIQDFATPAPGQCGTQSNRTKGVDPNRNYGGFWGGPGASANPTNDTYRGPAPFSEPETRNVRALVSTRQITTLITNHTYSDLVLRPPGLRAQGDPPDEPVYKKLGDAMAAENGYSSEKSWELYDTTGTTEDWSYYATGGLGFTFEIGKAADGPTGLETLAGVGFHPPYPVGVTNEYFGKYPNGGGNRAAYFKALESTADSKMHSVITGEAPPGSTIRLAKSFDTKTSPVIQTSGPPKPAFTFRDELDTTMRVPSSGFFELHANPSTRPVTVKGEPGRPATGPTTPDSTFKSAGNTTSFPAENALLSPPGSHQDFPFEIKQNEDDDKLTVVVSWADVKDDFDTYLFRENGAVDTQVASGAQGGGTTNTEQIVFRGAEGKKIEPGNYYVRVVDYSTTKKDFSGSMTFEGPAPFVAPAPRSEAWTLSCERGGNALTRREVVVDRAEQVDVGALCGGVNGRAGNTGTFGLSGSIQRAGRSALRYAVAVDRTRLRTALRRGVRVRGRCSDTCRMSMTMITDKRTARRLRLRSRTIATGRIAKPFAGRRTFRMRFNRTAQRRLRRARRVPVSVAVTVRDDGRRVATVRRKTTLRR
jgi:hypothetical protein